MSDAVLVREWDVDVFHRKVLGLETEGYISRRETYGVTAEMNPETGEIMHLRTIEMLKSDSEQK
jgi:hypothetical protein